MVTFTQTGDGSPAFVAVQDRWRLPQLGWLVLAMAAVVLAREAHIWIGVAVAIVAAIAGGLAFLCSHYARCPLRKILVEPGAIPRRVALAQR